MSSPAERPKLQGVIYQGDRPAGGISLPAETAESFIEAFNREYARLGMRVEAMAEDAAVADPPNSPQSAKLV